MYVVSFVKNKIWVSFNKVDKQSRVANLESFV